MGNFDQQIENALNQQMYEWVYRYTDDPTRTPYMNWMTESQFKSCYPNTVVIRKSN